MNKRMRRFKDETAPAIAKHNEGERFEENQKYREKADKEALKNPSFPQCSSSLAYSTSH